jgi:hypothetical protein
VAVVDANANPALDFPGEVRFEMAPGGALVAELASGALARGGAVVRFAPKTPGILRVAASALGGLLRARSNPIRVKETATERSVYWGDLHSHSHYSWDGVGVAPFEYARHVSGLDFYALTDHSSPPGPYTRGLGPHVWQEYNALTDRQYDPGRFVTLHAYEASFGTPYGHHNVYFRGGPGPLLAPGDGVGLPELWKALAAGSALTIPHHTGKFPAGVLWDVHDAGFRRNIEIYSAHGLSEAFDPEHPLAFEQSDFTGPSQSATGPRFAQDAWARGLTLSTIAASDDHRAQPGKAHWGLAAVHASGLTREAIFDALYDRRTYGTTGARILLEFAIDGHPMGQALAARAPPRLEVAAHGTDVIEEIQVLRHSNAAPGFEVVHTIRPDALDVNWTGVDAGFRGDAIYYVRVRQRGHINGRIAMAWSSPIWVRFVPAGPPDRRPSPSGVHRPSAPQPQPAAGDAIHEPQADDGERQPGDDDPDAEGDEHEQHAQADPEQAVPERPDLPLEMRIEPRPPHLGPFQVIEDHRNDRRPAGEEGADDGGGADDAREQAEGMEGVDELRPVVERSGSLAGVHVSIRTRTGSGVKRGSPIPYHWIPGAAPGAPPA